MEEEVSQLWMIEKEPEHLPRGVGSLGICVGSGGAATRPGLARSVMTHCFEDCLPARVDRRRAVRWFWRIAANAEATSLAAPQARPECTPIAA